MISVVTDSASMLPPAWRERWDVEVAPMTVVLDGQPHREGRDIESAEFYRRLAAGAEVSTSAPAPGEVLRAYQDAVARGATHIVSIHTGGDYSASIDAAQVAARQLDAPVELVDSGTASFPVALCVAAACVVRAAGGGVEEVVAAARSTAAEVDSIFIVGVPDLARRGGRLGHQAAGTGSTTLLTLGPSGLAEEGTAADVGDAIARMAAHVRSRLQDRALRVGVGDADRPDLGDRLASALDGAERLVDLTRYEIGPSVGAHSGAGTVGAVWAPG